jgi:O-antigen/teichoic acid export membrane protein
MPSNPLSRNTFTLLISNIGGAALSFMLFALLGRALGQSGFGAYNAALAWITPLWQLAEFGLGTLMTRDLAGNPAQTSAYLRATTRVRLWLGGGLMLALVVGAPLLSSDTSVIRGLQLSAPLILILPSFGAFTAVFRAAQKMWPIPWLNIGMLGVQIALTVLVFRMGGGVLAALLVNMLTSAGQLLAARCIWKSRFRHILTEGANRTLLPVMPLLKRAWPFALAAVLAALQSRAGTILLEKMTTTAEVGYYAAATRFVEAARLIPNALFGALFPALATLAIQPDRMNATFRRVMLGLTAFGGLLGLIFIPASGLILTLVYGSAFTPATAILQVAMIGLLPSLLRGGQTLYEYAQGRESFVNRVTAVVLVAQILIGLWLIPRWGALGEAWAVLFTETFGFALLRGGRVWKRYA